MPMLLEWLERPHVREWWDTPATFEELSSGAEPYIVMQDGEPIGYAQSYVALGSGGGWWEAETDAGVRGIDQFLCDGARLGQGLGTQVVKAFVARLFADPSVTRIQTDPDPRNARAIRCYEKAGFRPVKLIDTPDGRALYMVLDRPISGE